MDGTRLSWDRRGKRRAEREDSPPRMQWARRAVPSRFGGVLGGASGHAPSENSPPDDRNGLVDSHQCGAGEDGTRDSGHASQRGRTAKLNVGFPCGAQWVRRAEPSRMGGRGTLTRPPQRGRPARTKRRIPPVAHNGPVGPNHRGSGEGGAKRLDTPPPRVR